MQIEEMTDTPINRENANGMEPQFVQEHLVKDIILETHDFLIMANLQQAYNQILTNAMKLQKSPGRWRNQHQQHPAQEIRDHEDHTPRPPRQEVNQQKEELTGVLGILEDHCSY